MAEPVKSIAQRFFTRAVAEIEDSFPRMPEQQCECGEMIVFPCPGRFPTCSCPRCGNTYRFFITIEKLTRLIPRRAP